MFGLGFVNGFHFALWDRNPSVLRIGMRLYPIRLCLENKTALQCGEKIQPPHRTWLFLFRNGFLLSLAKRDSSRIDLGLLTSRAMAEKSPNRFQTHLNRSNGRQALNGSLSGPIFAPKTRPVVSGCVSK